MEIKICGITKPEEATYLNKGSANYAGFVFFEKSKRNLNIEKAREIFEVLDTNIKKVAVVVSPDVEMVEKLQKEDFDILQIHKNLSEEVLKTAIKPIWYAVNISDTKEAEDKISWINSLPEELSDKIKGIVVDAPEFGSGKTFNWRKSKRLLKAGSQSPPEEGLDIGDRLFILAGGLRPENVKEAIEIFDPDIVDVSSGVEGENGKDESLVLSFINNAVEAKTEV